MPGWALSKHVRKPGVTSHRSKANHRINPIAFYIIGGVVGGIVICTILHYLVRLFLNRRGRQIAEFDPVVLEEAKLQKKAHVAGNNESRMRKEVNRLRKLLKRKERELSYATSENEEVQNLLNTARENKEYSRRVEKEVDGMRDLRGRELYGDAWDHPSDCSDVPLRELFSLENDEVMAIRNEAVRQLTARGRTEDVERYNQLNQSSNPTFDVIEDDSRGYVSTENPLLISNELQDQIPIHGRSINAGIRARSVPNAPPPVIIPKLNLSQLRV